MVNVRMQNDVKLPPEQRRKYVIYTFFFVCLFSYLLSSALSFAILFSLFLILIVQTRKKKNQTQTSKIEVAFIRLALKCVISPRYTQESTNTQY